MTLEDELESGTVRNVLFTEALTDRELREVVRSLDGAPTRPDRRLVDVGLLTQRANVPDNDLGAALGDLQDYADRTDQVAGPGTFFGSNLRSLLTELCLLAPDGTATVDELARHAYALGTRWRVEQVLREFAAGQFVEYHEGAADEAPYVTVSDGGVASYLRSVHRSATRTETIHDRLLSLGYTRSDIAGHPGLPSDRVAVSGDRLEDPFVTSST